MITYRVTEEEAYLLTAAALIAARYHRHMSFITRHMQDDLLGDADKLEELWHKMHEQERIQEE